jgi:energy-coupling factor transporter ATP-binding protein EcfA2
MKQIDTGDRMTDTTLQMIGTTLVGALMSALILLYTKGYWKELLQTTNAALKSNYNPLDFDPSLAPCKAQNGKMFQFKSANMAEENAVVINWFYTHHRSKQYKFPETQLTSFVVPDKLDITTESEFKAMRRRADRIATNMHVYIPIWRDMNGHYVYMTTDDESSSEYLCLNSDSANAILNCVESIRAHRKSCSYFDKTSKKEQFLYEMKTDSDGDTGFHATGTLSPLKTFDTLFFTQKPKILPLLEKFKEGTLIPKHLPMDPSLGILLYGPPGTGKTGFIAALANFLKQDICMVDMKKIKTQRAFNDALNHASGHNRILVLEEIDCMEGILTRKHSTSKKTEVEKPTMADPNASLMMMMMSNNKELLNEYKKERLTQSDSLDLGYLLRKLDGLESSKGRVIVATTNHPERIDPALLRPGRLGIHLRLGNATHQMMRDIIGMIYQTPISEEDVEDIQEDVWCPAEILKRGLEYEDPKALLASLTTLSSGLSSETASTSDEE